MNAITQPAYCTQSQQHDVNASVAVTLALLCTLSQQRGVTASFAVTWESSSVVSIKPWTCQLHYSEEKEENKKTTKERDGAEDEKTSRTIREIQIFRQSPLASHIENALIILLTQK